MKLELTPDTLAVCQLKPNDPIPAWAMQGKFFSISKTEDELSIVCEQSSLPAGVKCEPDWRAFKVQGPLDFSLTGILASLATPLAAAAISIFAISTFDTDYVLIKAVSLSRAMEVLQSNGHTIETP